MCSREAVGPTDGSRWRRGGGLAVAWRWWLGGLLAGLLAWPVTGLAVSFSDLPASAALTPYAASVSSLGIMSGFPDGTFQPDGEVTRAQAAKMLDVLAGLPPASGQTLNTFTDVPSGYWAYPWIVTAAAHHLVDGYGDGTFRPHAPIDRAELVAMALRATGQPVAAVTGTAVSDVATGSWAYPYVTTALAAGLVSAPGGSFDPAAPADRGFAARLLARAAVYTLTAANQSLPAVAVPLTGTVDVVDVGGVSSQLTASQEVRPGESLVSGPTGTAQVNFPDGSSILIEPNSHLTFVAMYGSRVLSTNGRMVVGVDDLEVRLDAGQLFVALAPLAPPAAGALAPTGPVTASGGPARAMGPTAHGQNRLVAMLASDLASGGGPPPAAAATLVLSAQPPSLVADGRDTASVTVTMEDSGGNPVYAPSGGVAVTVAVRHGTGDRQTLVIPAGQAGANFNVTAPAATPPDGKVWITASAGQLTSTLRLPASSLSWWQALFSQRVRVKVDMPWTVAAVRGTFAHVAVTASGDEADAVTGVLGVTAAGQTVAVPPAHEVTVSAPNLPPPPPVAMTVSTQQRWSTATHWVNQQATAIAQLAPTQAQTAVHEEASQLQAVVQALPVLRQPPTLTVSRPTEGATTGHHHLTVAGHAADAVQLSGVTVDGQSVDVQEDGSFSATVTLSPGPNTITVVAENAGGLTATAVRHVTYNPALPNITVKVPEEYYLTSPAVIIRGTATSPVGIATLTVAGVTATLASDGSFAVPMTLAPGTNDVVVTATDSTGQSATRTIHLRYAASGPRLVVTSPA